MVEAGQTKHTIFDCRFQTVDLKGSVKPPLDNVSLIPFYQVKDDLKVIRSRKGVP